jgi:hypothetical protein
MKVRTGDTRFPIRKGTQPEEMRRGQNFNPSATPITRRAS